MAIHLFRLKTLPLTGTATETDTATGTATEVEAETGTATKITACGIFPACGFLSGSIPDKPGFKAGCAGSPFPGKHSPAAF